MAELADNGESKAKCLEQLSSTPCHFLTIGNTIVCNGSWR